jgi:hypothetical protein
MPSSFQTQGQPQKKYVPAPLLRFSTPKCSERHESAAAGFVRFLIEQGFHLGE